MTAGGNSQCEWQGLEATAAVVVRTSKDWDGQLAAGRMRKARKQVTMQIQ